MSNTVGNKLLHQSFLHPTILENRSRSVLPTCSLRNTLFQSQANSSIHISSISTPFHGNRLTTQKNKLHMGKQLAFPRTIRAVLATDASSRTEKFNLNKNIELLVDVEPPTSGSGSIVNIQATSNSNGLLLHWGATKSRTENWILPDCRPAGTMVYKNKALRSPFVKSGPNAVLRIEIEDPAIQALEFLIFDEAQNKWFKYNGGNFHVNLPNSESTAPNVSVPEDLVQIQAYLRWERNGKQVYTPEKEKEEYEAARMELLEDIAGGSSITDLRAKLASGSVTSESTEQSKTKSSVPDDIIQTQAYIRWEKAGKPISSPEQQLVEFEEARKELPAELENVASLDDIRRNIIKGDIQTKVSKQLNHSLLPS